MNRFFIGIYDWFCHHKIVGWASCVLLTVALVLSMLSLHYKEDISAFLPLDKENQTALNVYQDISGAGKIFAIISTKDTTDVDPQELVDGVEKFTTIIAESDSLGYISNIVKQIDLDQVMEIGDEVYENIPYFLTEKDYARIDSLLASPEYIQRKIDEDKQLLLFPTSGVIVQNIARDPLDLFSPAINRLSNTGGTINHDTYDGYILSPDGQKAIAILQSSFGANESENNSKLVGLLNNAANITMAENPRLDVHVIGGPVIAVSNADRIKSDSVLAVAIAGILIIALLIYMFRSARNICLIIVSVAWGWLFAIGIIGLFYSSVSLIVIGISSVILGIAINYPLHLIDHLRESENRRAAMKEIISPLVVGNITTVGAFLCLVPLNASALHDLGLYASLLLVGTILFVLIFLPHLVKTRKPGSAKVEAPALITRISSIKLENNKWAVRVILILTVIFGFFSFKTEFDSDMRNINYLTPEQKTDMEYFQRLSTGSNKTESIYVVSSGDSWDKALSQNDHISKTIDSLVCVGLATKHNEVSDFLTSEKVQQSRLVKWNAFVHKYPNLLSEISRAGETAGFSEDAFSNFADIVTADYSPVGIDHFESLTSLAFMNNLSIGADSIKHVVQSIEVSTDRVDKIKEHIKAQDGFDGLAFDVKSMNSSIANTLSDDFNYIGIVCGCIVFLFLWLSLGSIELAIVSFMPMAVSWIWILGIMGMLGIKFNLVNIILATFIFGQGDDYTIFMTEGLSYELAYRKKVLASFKNSITVSALIMFIGIGTLIFAKHPAMRSLGEVTIVGMLSVVVMAYLIPPLIFNWLVKKRGKLRERPITLKKILCTGFCAFVFLSQLMVAYILGFFMFVLTKRTPKKEQLLHRFCCSVFRWDVKRMPGQKFRYVNKQNEDFSKPAVIISNHQSLLDSFYLMTLSPKMVMLANDHVGENIITGRMFRWLGFVTVGQGYEKMSEKIRPYIEQGYSVALFPEGERPRKASPVIKRFHKGAVQFAQDFNLDILPVYLYGIAQAMPKGVAISNGGEIQIEVGKRITPAQLMAFGDTEQLRSQAIHELYQNHFTEIRRTLSTVKQLSPIVYDRYRYKGLEIEQIARKAIKIFSANKTKLEGLYNGKNFLVVENGTNGELSLLLALMYPEADIFSYPASEHSRSIMEGCADNFVKNVQIISYNELMAIQKDDLNVYYTGEGDSSIKDSILGPHTIFII